MNRTTYLLKKLTRRRELVQSLIIDGNPLKIVDEKYLFNLFPSMRIMEGLGGWYSAIYKSKKNVNQPVYPEIQSLIESWNSVHPSSNYLILGCAGCAIPRFISLSYYHSKIIGVEKSSEMISIAKQFFFDGIEEKDIELVQADAFEFVGSHKLKHDVCMVDLFDSSKIIAKIYRESFIHDLSEITSDTAIVLFNFFGQSKKQGEALCEIAKKYFTSSHLLSIKDGFLPVFIKGNGNMVF